MKANISILGVSALLSASLNAQHDHGPGNSLSEQVTLETQLDNNQSSSSELSEIQNNTKKTNEPSLN